MLHLDAGLAGELSRAIMRVPGAKRDFKNNRMFSNLYRTTSQTE